MPNTISHLRNNTQRGIMSIVMLFSFIAMSSMALMLIFLQDSYRQESIREQVLANLALATTYVVQQTGYQTSASVFPFPVGNIQSNPISRIHAGITINSNNDIVYAAHPWETITPLGLNLNDEILFLGCTATDIGTGPLGCSSSNVTCYERHCSYHGTWFGTSSHSGFGFNPIETNINARSAINEILFSKPDDYATPLLVLVLDASYSMILNNSGTIDTTGNSAYDQLSAVVKELVDNYINKSANKIQIAIVLYSVEEELSDLTRIINFGGYNSSTTGLDSILTPLETATVTNLLDNNHPKDNPNTAGATRTDIALRKAEEMLDAHFRITDSTTDTDGLHKNRGYVILISDGAPRAEDSSCSNLIDGATTITESTVNAAESLKNKYNLLTLLIQRDIDGQTSEDDSTCGSITTTDGFASFMYGIASEAEPCGRSHAVRVPEYGPATGVRDTLSWVIEQQTSGRGTTYSLLAGTYCTVHPTGRRISGTADWDIYSLFFGDCVDGECIRKDSYGNEITDAFGNSVVPETGLFGTIAAECSVTLKTISLQGGNPWAPVSTISLNQQKQIETPVLFISRGSSSYGTEYRLRAIDYEEYSPGIITSEKDDFDPYNSTIGASVDRNKLLGRIITEHWNIVVDHDKYKNVLLRPDIPHTDPLDAWPQIPPNVNFNNVYEYYFVTGYDSSDNDMKIFLNKHACTALAQEDYNLIVRLNKGRLISN